MIIFLYGQDSYRSRQKLNEIISHYKKIHKTELNLKYLDFEKDNYEDFQNIFQSSSMFGEKKLLVIENAVLNKNFEKNFLRDSKKFLDSKDIILFYEGKEIPEKEKFFQFLKKAGKSQEFRPLEGQNLKNWIKKEFEKYKVKIEEKALEKLIDFVGNNLWQMANEIEKLAAFKGNQEIEKKDIELLVRPKIETDIFKTIDAIAEKNKRKALTLIHQHLEKGDSPLYLLSMINFQFRNLLIIKSRYQYTNSIPMIPIAKKLGLHSYIIKKTIWQAKKFSLPELKKIYQKIFQTDLNIKTGKIEPETALDLLVSEL